MYVLQNVLDLVDGLFLRQGAHTGGQKRGILVPVPTAPVYVKLNDEEAKALLKKSGAYLLFYASDPCVQETEWWYVICDRFNLKELSSNTRSKIIEVLENVLLKLLMLIGLLNMAMNVIPVPSGVIRMQLQLVKRLSIMTKTSPQRGHLSFGVFLWKNN